MAVTVSEARFKPEPIRVTLDVGGKQFKTTTATLKTMPSTKLGKLSQEAEQMQLKSLELFFDRNPKIMNSLLDLYRTGKLHIPGHMCVAAAVEELEFWEVPVELLQDCCWKRFESHESDEGVVAEIDRFLEDLNADFQMKEAQTWRMKIWMTLERPGDSTASKIWSVVFYVFIFVSVMTFALENIRGFRTLRSTFVETFPQVRNWTLEDVEQAMQMDPIDVLAITLPHAWLMCLRYVTFAFFLLDLIVRLLVCPAKKRFFLQVRNWLELFLAAQSLMFFILESSTIPAKIRARDVSDTERHLFTVVMAFSAVRALRIFYMAKNFDRMLILALCAKSSVKELLMLVICVVSFVTLFGTLVYTVEVLDALQTFSSIPSGMWWAIVTMTTVGYGDVYPVSVGGKVVGSVCALCGLIVVALPIAVIASKFSTYHDNLAPRQLRRARLAGLKKPEFDLGGTDLKMKGQGQGQGRGCCLENDGSGEGGGKMKRKQRGSGGRCKVDVISLSGEDASGKSDSEKF